MAFEIRLELFLVLDKWRGAGNNYRCNICFSSMQSVQYLQYFNRHTCYKSHWFVYSTKVSESFTFPNSSAQKRPSLKRANNQCLYSCNFVRTKGEKSSKFESNSSHFSSVSVTIPPKYCLFLLI